MKFAVAAILLPQALASVAGLQNRAACNADNCARAVTGTVKGGATYASHIADCSSYQATQIFPAASTITVTQGSTSTTITPAGVTPLTTASTNTPTSVPAYASPCSGTSRYASACSCAGILPTLVTQTTPTVTVVVPTASPSYVACSNTYPDNYPFYCSQPDSCVCFHAAHGGGICGNPNGSCNGSCSSDSDCPSGTYCLVRTNCAGNGSTCTSHDETEVTCANSAAPAKMFRRGGAPRLFDN